MSKKIKSNLYMTSKIKLIQHKLTLVRDPDGFLFSQGRYRTKILPEDLPEWYVLGYIYKQYGYLSAKGVKHLVYFPNYSFDNQLHKYDTLFVSYGSEIEPFQTETSLSWYNGYDHAIGGSFIVRFIEAVEKYSDYDVSEIQKELARKQAWYYERNPE